MPHKKPTTGWIIASGALLLTVLAVILMLNTPKARLLRAFANTVEALPGLALPNTDEYSDTLALTLENETTAGLSQPFRLESRGSFRRSERSAAAELGIYYGSARLLELEAGLADDVLWVDCPELLSRPLGLRAGALGQELAALGIGGAEDLTIEPFETGPVMSLFHLTKEQAQPLTEYAAGLLRQLKVTSDGRQTLQLGDSAIDCRRYSVTVPRADAQELLTRLEAVCGQAFPDAPAEDPVLRFWVSGGYVAAIGYSGQWDGSTVSAQLVSGGEPYGSSLSLSWIREDSSFSLDATHAGQDTWDIHAAITTSGGSRITAAGQLTLGAETFRAELDDVTLTGASGSQTFLTVSYARGAYEAMEAPGGLRLVGQLSKLETLALQTELRLNAAARATVLMLQLPELRQLLLDTVLN